ncbi:HAMP domain protein [Bordetella bronchiseptica CA90 BB1334]|nr:HAMP domain protein [Bordetella bronchiseptica CA90 BB1334]
MFANLKVRTGLLLALVALALAALVSIALGWESVREGSRSLHALDSVSVQQGSLLKDAYAQMLRATIRADIAAVQRRGGDAAGALENERTVKQLMGEAKARIEAFRKVPKLSELGRSMETGLTSSFGSFAASLDEMMAALERNDDAAYLQLKNVKAGQASAAFAARLGEFSTNLDKLSSETLAAHETRETIMLYVYAALLLLIVGVIAGSYLYMTRAVVRPLQRASQQFERMAAGDLSARIEVNSRNEIGALLTALRHMQESLTRTVAAVRRGVDEINVGSREISAGNTDLSSRTEEQAASLEETAASMEQLASTVKQNADNARQANQLAASASDVAERGRFNAANSWPISLLLRTSTRAVRSPAAILSKCWPASLSGRTTRRPNTVRATSIRTKASTTAAVTAIRARSKLVRAASMVACCCSLMYLLKSPMAAMKAALRGVPYSLLTM